MSQIEKLGEVMSIVTLILAMFLGAILMRLFTLPKPERTENPKNCPFCGKKPVLAKADSFFFVHCANEQCLFGPDRGNTQGAIAAWNRIEVRQ